MTFVITGHVTVLRPCRHVNRQLADFPIKKAWTLENKQRDQVFINDYQFVLHSRRGLFKDQGYKLNHSFAIVQTGGTLVFENHFDVVAAFRFQMTPKSPKAVLDLWKYRVLHFAAYFTNLIAAKLYTVHRE